MHQLGVFKWVFVAMVVLCFVIRAPWEYRNKKLRASESRDSGREKFNLLLVFTGSATMPVLYLLSPWFDFANYPISLARGLAGSAVAALGVYLFWRSHADLGRQFSPTLEVKEAHALVSHGVYRRIRHPMYSAAFLLAMAQLLLLANFVVGPAFLLAFSLLYFSRIDHEETMMRDHFGAQYVAYCKRTNRLWPSFRSSD